MVLNQEANQVLMCFRNKDPYKGKYNLIGGKIELGEDYLTSAYRELLEETGVTNSDISLKPFIDYKWHMLDMEMKVFIGKLNKEVELIEEVHELFWIDIKENFFDSKRFAGEGNIGHMVEIYLEYPEIVEQKQEKS